MSINIEREGNRFRVRLSGDRTRIYARTLAEACEAVIHYYGSHHSHMIETANCPVCLVIARNHAKREREIATPIARARGQS